jgi:large subunit ribosomal protein L15
MSETNLPKTVTRRKKRLGRGYGSGKGGHTSGRGQKGQKTRKRIGILFEGVKTRKSLIKRIPQFRGKGKLKSRPKPIVLNLDHLNTFTAGAKVDLDAIIKKGIVNEKQAKSFGVKILGTGKLTKKLNVELPVSESAAKKIKKAGGKTPEETK